MTQLIASRPPDRDLGTAFGEYGMLLHAAEYHDAAEPAYRNAQRLAPDDVRWSYHLAQLYRHRGDTDSAIAEFTRVIDRRPNDVATLIWLGRMYLDGGDAPRAESLFARAQSLAPEAAAARVGLGQAALARKDYQRAVQELEAALTVNPQLASVYAPLAVAYRGLGQTGKAESLQKQWRNTDVEVPDPLKMEVHRGVFPGQG